jgi:hypothetical protein
MDGCMDGWMHGWMDEWMDKKKDALINGWGLVEFITNEKKERLTK